jgi:radical SAM superfamily enzyme YgiQ (UPF0313 family)
MHALLLYPEFPETFWSFSHALKLMRKKASAPPLGLLTVAAMLPESWELRLVDLNATRLADADLAWADCALVSGMVIQRDSARRVIARCKSAGLTIIAGGPLFTSEPEHFDEVDHLVLNEAEVTLAPFLADFERGEAKHIYRSSEFAEMADSPVPRWDLAEERNYASKQIQYSRGCPFNCDFCSVTELFGHKWRTKSADQIIAELDSLYGLGWRGSVVFVDDNLIGDKRQLREELLPALIQWKKGKMGVSFSTQVTINLADDDALMEEMVKAGFDTVFVGIESLDEESLTECNKKQNRDRELLEDVRRMQHAGLQVQGGFIVGFDHDTPSVFQSQIDFIQKSGIVTAMVGLLQAPAGTGLYERMKREGRVNEGMSGDNVDGTTNIMPRMGLSPLQDGYRRMLLDLYAPRSYYKRLRTFLREYKPPRATPGSLKAWHVRTFFRSLYYMGIVGKERFQYPSLLLWTLFSRPRAFPTAIILAISGYHFRKCSELHIV